MVKRKEPPPAIFLFFACGVLIKRPWAYDVMRARTLLQNVGKMKKGVLLQPFGHVDTSNR